MIEEIKRKDLDKDIAIFPDVKIDIITVDENSTLYLETVVQIDNYLSHIMKKYEYKNNINYVTLMQFIDSLETDVTRLKKEFNSDIYKNNKSETIGIYKIIE